MSFFNWLKRIFARKKQQQAWDNLYNDTTKKADNLPLDPANDTWRT